MFETIMMTFKLTWQNRRWSWHLCVCCISHGNIKGDWWFWCRFVPNLLGYMHTNNYLNMKRFDKVIAKKTKSCSFLPYRLYYTFTGKYAARYPTRRYKRRLPLSPRVIAGIRHEEHHGQHCSITW